MKASKILLWSFAALVLCLTLGAWTIHDYGLTCTKCLDASRVKEHHLLGIVLSHQERQGDPPAEYERIFGHACEHTYHKGGLSTIAVPSVRMIMGCGPPSVSGPFRLRVNALYATYSAGHRLADRALTLETFQLIDRLMPPDTQIKQDPDLPQKSHESLLLLAHYLPRSSTVDQWRAILDSARNDFVDTSQLPAE